MSEDQFTKLFKYMGERFESMEAAHAELKAELKADIDRVYQLVDEDLRRREIDEHERLAIGSQLDQHERWIEQLAKSTKTTLAAEA